MAMKDFIKNQAVNKATEKASESTKNAIRTAQRLRKNAVTAIKTFKASSGAIAMLLNPATWIVVAIVLGIVLVSGMVMSGFQVFGRNENADGCFGIGQSGGEAGSLYGNVETSEDAWERANIVAGHLMTENYSINGDRPMSLEQTAAIIGNWMQESQVNPAAVQPGRVMLDATNEFIASLPNVGGQAVGLAQWEYFRRPDLVKLADERGVMWNDMGLQLDFFKGELTHLPGQWLVDEGFTQPGKSVEFLTDAFQKGFERAGHPVPEARIAFAKQFLDQWDGAVGGIVESGSGGGKTGGSCLMGNGSGGGTYDTSDVSKLAIDLAWDNAQQAAVKGDQTGINVAKPEYLSAKKEAMDRTGQDPMAGLYASCDRFVATVMRLTVDPNFPWGATRQQYDYLNSSPNWERYDNISERRPGDVWAVIPNAHIVIYAGEVDGVDTMAHASYTTHTAFKTSVDSYMNDNFVDVLGRKYAGFHFVGQNPDNSGSGEE